MCDSTNMKPGLERITEKEKEDNVRKPGYTMTFPTKEEVNFALDRFETFDLPPYGKESSCNFKNIGAIGDVPPASNHPIFALHHSFVDRICEKWLRKFNKNASVLSTNNSPIGHNKNDVIIPLCPLYTHQQMFKKSFEFGYDHNDVDENGKYA